MSADVAFSTPVLTPIWDMGSGGAQDPPPTQLGQAQQTIAANWSNLRGLREQQALALRNSINPAADVTRVVLPIPGEEASKFMGASVSGDNVPRMSAPPPGWSLQRPFEKETTAAEWFESTDIPLMAVVRGITEIPARSLEVTANYACILATGKRCDGSDPTPEDLESGYYSIMPGGGKGLKGAMGAGNILKFGGDEAIVHFGKHGKSVMDALGKSSYNLKNYLDDANHIIRNGTYVPELNGYVRLIGGQGSAKFGFVGLNRTTGNITTFHIKTAKELAKKAPGMFSY